MQQCQNSNGLYQPTSNGTSLNDILNNQRNSNDQQCPQNNTISDNTQNNKIDEKIVKENNKNQSDDEYKLIETLQKELLKKHKKQYNVNDLISKKKCPGKLSKAGILIEPLILLTIYVILSQSNVIAFFAEYVGQLQPDADNYIPLSGVIIYGTILVFLFLVARQIIYIFC